MDKIKDNFKTILTFAAVLGVAVSFLGYFAKAADLEHYKAEACQLIKASEDRAQKAEADLKEYIQLVDVRLNQKIIGDRINILEQQKFTIENRNGTSNVHQFRNESDKQQYRSLNKMIDDLKKELMRAK